MEENYLKALSFLLKIVILLQLVYCINNIPFKAEATQSELYHRMSTIEAQNQHHEKEISLLKMAKVEDRKEIHQLRERVALLESSTFSNSSSDKKLRRRSKRPARLLPINILKFRKNNPIENEEEAASAQKFYGPPTSCDDLKKLGYTLNGYYLIKGKGKLNSSYRIQAIYCRFYQPTGVKQALQELVGTVDIKTNNAHFYVQRSTSFKTPDASIPFELARINEGNVFNLTSGIFTAPVNGIYHFQLSAVKSESFNYLEVLLQVNGGHIGSSFSYRPNAGSAEGISMSASLRLVAGDKVRLVCYKNSVLYDDGSHKTHFTGWLVEEDLM